MAETKRARASCCSTINNGISCIMKSGHLRSRILTNFVTILEIAYPSSENDEGKNCLTLHKQYYNLINSVRL